MGILGKFKNIFYDTIEEEEEEVVVKTKPEEIKKPKIEEIKFENIKEEKAEPISRREEVIKSENTFSERELFKPERTFNFTEFDDDEEEEIKPRVNVMDLERQNKNNQNKTSVNNSKVGYTTRPETPKVFKPSPVISPIYGILDKDYRKEEVRQKSSPSVENTSSYDTVRKKAYGSSTDNIEDSIIKVTTTDITAVVKDIDKDVDRLSKTAKLEDLISEIERNADLTVGEIEDKVAEKNYLEETNEIPIKEEKDYNDRTMTSNTLEHDLFNLIDSMYDDKED